MFKGPLKCLRDSNCFTLERQSCSCQAAVSRHRKKILILRCGWSMMWARGWLDQPPKTDHFVFCEILYLSWVRMNPSHYKSGYFTHLGIQNMNMQRCDPPGAEQAIFHFMGPLNSSSNRFIIGKSGSACLNLTSQRVLRKGKRCLYFHTFCPCLYCIF